MGASRQPHTYPVAVDVGVLLILEEDNFAALLRDHLTPRSGPGDRERWARLWNVLASRAC